jgi:CubicO group peptidase (beta-lactamase class C family)
MNVRPIDVAALLLAVASPAVAQRATVVRPVAAASATPASMLDRMKDSASRVLIAAHLDGAFPGAVTLFGTRAGAARLVGVGRLDARDSSTAGPGTIYDLASLTKVIATTTLMLQLVDQGRVTLDSPVVRYLPSWRGPRTERITVRQLLTHSSGLAAWRPFYKEAADAADARAQLLLVGPDAPPGTRYLYSDMNFMLLGLLIEQVTGQPLDSAFQQRIARPLKLGNTRFRPDSSTVARTAPTEFDPWRQRQLRGEVHDENAARFGGVSGHAGLFSTAEDLAIVARLWMNGGTVNGVRIASPKTVAEFTRVQDSLISKRSLGWETPTGGNSAGHLLSPRAFGHTGFTGTSIWMDPAEDLFIVLLTNRVNPTRENRKIGGVRVALADAIVAAKRGAAARQPTASSP